MKSLQLVQFGDPASSIELRDVPDPSPPQVGEVLIGVQYSPINSNDINVANGMSDFYGYGHELPIQIGNEGTGTVLEVGDGVQSPRVGDRVILPLCSGTWAERVIAPADGVFVLPADSDPHQAAMLAVNAFAAVLMLDEFVKLRPGDAVAYNAANSGLGRWVAALAKRRGLRAIGLIRSQSDVKDVLASGADIVIVDDEDITEAQKRLAGFNIPLALDGVGGAAAGRLIELLNDASATTLIVYAGASGQPISTPGLVFIGKNLTITGLFSVAPQWASKLAPALNETAALIGRDGVRQPVAAIYPIEQCEDAFRHAVRGGRVLLDFTESRPR